MSDQEQTTKEEQASEDAKPYVIQPRDTALTIALMHEVEVDKLTKHAKNAEIFEDKKRDPHMLAPGEILYIPPPEPPTPVVAPKATNRFVAKVPMVHLHLCFHSEKGPLEGEEFLIESPIVEQLTKKRADQDKPLEGKLDGEGNLSLKVPALTRSFVIEFPKRHIEHEIWVGGLDPLDQRGGINARLLHLGYLPVDQELKDPFLFETETSERATLRSFQEAFALEPSGFVDQPTQDALSKAHGS